MAVTSVKRERVQGALAGEPVDRPPVSMWRHFYEFEETAAGLAEAMLGFQRQFDWDFMKVNPRAQYHVEDWGARYRYSADPHQSPTRTHVPVQSPEDWQQIVRLDPLKGSLDEHLRALNHIANGLRGEVPFVMTVFTPLAIAARLVESDQAMLEHLHEYPEEVHAALQSITESFRAYVTECLNAGVDGIFLATTSWASHDLLTDDEYREFGKPYDLQVLEAAREAPLNILHVCKDNNMLQSLADYPVHALNWDTRSDTNPSLEEARQFTSRALLGGVSGETLLKGQPDAVAQEVREAVAQTEGQRLMVGPNCSIPPGCPQANLRTVQEALA